MVRTRPISNVKIYLPTGFSPLRFSFSDVMELLNCGILNVQASGRKSVLTTNNGESSNMVFLDRKVHV